MKSQQQAPRAVPVLDVTWLSAERERRLVASEELAIRLMELGGFDEALMVLRDGTWSRPDEKRDKLRAWINDGCPPAKIVFVPIG